MHLRSIAFALFVGSVPSLVMAQLDSPNRKEHERVDLTGAPGMEVVIVDKGKPLYDEPK